VIRKPERTKKIETPTCPERQTVRSGTDSVTATPRDAGGKRNA